MLTFTINDFLLHTIYAIGALPVVHIFFAFVLPKTKTGSVPLVVSAVTAAGFWLFLAWALPPANGFVPSEFLVGLSAFLGLLLCFVWFWFLLDRGYTLNMALVLARENQVSSAEEFARIYGDGQGLEWLFRKRLDGLVMLGLIRYDEKKIELTPGLGVRVARVLRLFSKLLGIFHGG